MTLFHLHHDDVHHFGREKHLPLKHALGWIGSALRTLHGAIVSARLRRLPDQLMFRNDYTEVLPPEQDLKKFPQRPMVLGDKWDF